MQKLTATIFLFLFITTTALGQVEPDSTADPFENDPFFSAPFGSFGDSHSTSDTTTHHPKTERFVMSLNDEGLDFREIIESGPKNSNPLYSVYPSLPMIHYNRVSSLFLGIKKERMQWHHHNEWLGIPNIQAHGMIGYSTGQREWQYSLGLERIIGKKDHIIIGGEYHNATTTNDEWRVGLNETSITAFTAGYDYLDYYKQKGWGAYLLARTHRYFEGGIAFSDDQFSSLSKETNWSLFGKEERYRSNPPVALQNGTAVDKVNLSSLTLSASFNPKRLVLTKNVTLSLSGTAEFADPGIGTTSDYDYTKYSGELISYINFEPGGVFKYRLRMSSIAGEAPHFKQLYLGGVGTLRALPYKSLGSGNKMVLSNAVVQFGQPKRGASDWINFDDFYLSLFLDSGWVNDESGLENSQSSSTGFSNFAITDLKHNGGIGLGSSLIRAEVAWDLNTPSRAPVFWLRLNPTF